MLEQDYLSLQKHEGILSGPVPARNTNQLGSQIVREIVIPELTKEVNEDRNFSRLRQVYNSLILATWYKKKIKDSILEQVYADRNKVAGVNIDDPQEKQRIYERYLQAFKKGVFNYIKDTETPEGVSMPRKYFSGGMNIDPAQVIFTVHDTDSAMNAEIRNSHAFLVQAGIEPKTPTADKAMNTNIFDPRSPLFWINPWGGLTLAPATVIAIAVATRYVLKVRKVRTSYQRYIYTRTGIKFNELNKLTQSLFYRIDIDWIVKVFQHSSNTVALLEEINKISQWIEESDDIKEILELYSDFEMKGLEPGETIEVQQDEKAFIYDQDRVPKYALNGYSTFNEYSDVVLRKQVEDKGLNWENFIINLKKIKWVDLDLKGIGIPSYLLGDLGGVNPRSLSEVVLKEDWWRKEKSKLKIFGMDALKVSNILNQSHKDRKLRKNWAKIENSRQFTTKDNLLEFVVARKGEANVLLVRNLSPKRLFYKHININTAMAYQDRAMNSVYFSKSKFEKKLSTAYQFMGPDRKQYYVKFSGVDIEKFGYEAAEFVGANTPEVFLIDRNLINALPIPNRYREFIGNPNKAIVIKSIFEMTMEDLRTHDSSGLEETIILTYLLGHSDWKIYVPHLDGEHKNVVIKTINKGKKYILFDFGNWGYRREDPISPGKFSTVNWINDILDVNLEHFNDVLNRIEQDKDGFEALLKKNQGILIDGEIRKVRALQHNLRNNILADLILRYREPFFDTVEKKDKLRQSIELLQDAAISASNFKNTVGFNWIRTVYSQTDDLTQLPKNVSDHMMIIQADMAMKAQQKIAASRVERNDDAKNILVYLIFQKILGGVNSGEILNSFSLETLIKERPEFITADFVKGLYKGLEKENSNFRGNAFRTLDVVIDVRPDLIDEYVINVILAGLKAFPGDERFLKLIKKLVHTKSQLITSELIDELLGELKASRIDENKNFSIWETLVEIIKAKKEFTALVLPYFKENLDKDFPLDDIIMAALALGDIRNIYPDLIDEEHLEERLRKLREIPMVGNEASFIIALSKSAPKLIYPKDIEDFDSWKNSINALDAIQAIIATRKDLINEEFILKILGLKKKLDFLLKEEFAIIIAAIVKARPEFAEMIISWTWKEATSNFFGWFMDRDLIENLMGARKEIAMDILERALNTPVKGDFDTGFQGIAPVIIYAAEFIPENIDDRIMDKIFDFYKASDFSSAYYFERNFAKIILAIGKTNKNYAVKMIDKFMEKRKEKFKGSAFGRFYRSQGLEDDFSSEMVEAFAKFKPQYLSREMVKSLFRLVAPVESDEDRRAEAEMPAAYEAIGEVYTSRPDLVHDGDLMENLLSWSRNSEINPLVHVLSHDGIDNNKVDFYKNELTDQWGLKPAKNSSFDDELLIYAYLLVNHEDIVLLSKFAGQDEKEFIDLISTISQSIKSGKGNEIIPLLKQHTDIEGLSQEFSLDKLLAERDLDVFEPTRSWNNLEQWLSTLHQLPQLKDKIIPHIVITMALLRQGVGDQGGFRNMDSVEERLPRIRRSVEDILQHMTDPLARKRLVKVLAFGSQDEVELLRRQAVQMVVALLGRDSRTGIAGTIRNRIHNQPSPQDLMVMKAYRHYVETGDPVGLGKFNYHPEASDVVPAIKKQAVLAACDNLLKTLEYIYGDENTTALNDFLGRLNLGPGESIKEKAALFANGNQPKGLDALDKIISIRKDLFTLNRNVTGEPLLSAIKLDNRMELLYYRFFNEYTMTLNIHNFDQMNPVLLNLLQNASLNGYSPDEIKIIIDELESLDRNPKKSGQDWLKIYAILKRVENILRIAAKDTVDHYQPMAQRIGRSLGAENSYWVENFSSNLFRSDTVYLLSTFLTPLKQEAMRQAKISGWQVIVPGQTEGRLRFLSSDDDLNNIKADEIIVLDKFPSELASNVNVRGIIVLSEDSLLSHPAIRARQNNIPMVVCPNRDLIEKYSGKHVLMRISGDEDVFIEEMNGESEVPGAVLRKTKKKRLRVKPLEVILNNKSGFIIDANDYSRETVGNKAFQLNKIPAGLITEQFEAKHFSLSFGFYQFVLDLPENESIKREMNGILEQLKKTTSIERKTELLFKIRIAVRRLIIPDEYLIDISDKINKEFGRNTRVFMRSTTSAEDLDGYAGAGLYDSFGDVAPTPKTLGIYIKKVWASVWNTRAYFDRGYHGIKHEKVFPAVLIQEMVPAAYAFVVHTQNPSNKDEIVLEVIQGFGEALVSGDDEFIGSPYRYIYNRKTNDFKFVRFASKGKRIRMTREGFLETSLASYMDDPLVSQGGSQVMESVIKGALKIEKFSNAPQDIEGAVVLNQKKWGVTFLQTRDQVGRVDKAAISIPISRDEPLEKSSIVDSAQKGGIDLTPADNVLQTQNSGQGIKFHIDAAQLARLQNAPGFVPVIINIQPLKDLYGFLGIVHIK